MSYKEPMFKKKQDIQNIRTKWSLKMLQDFFDSCFRLCAKPGTLPMLIKERVLETSFNTNNKIDSSIGFQGILAKADFEDVYFAFSTDQNEGEIKDSQKHIGYLEVLNGISDERVPVPMIRAFIWQSTNMFDTINSYIRDAKIFNNNIPTIILNVHVDLKMSPKINATNIMNTKIGIDSVKIYQRLNIYNDL